MKITFQTNLKLVSLNQELLDRLRGAYIAQLCQNDKSDTDDFKKGFKYSPAAELKFGFYGEHWNGKPNKYIEQDTIDELRKKFDVTQEQYDTFYGFKGAVRVEILSMMLAECVRRNILKCDEVN